MLQENRIYLFFVLITFLSILTACSPEGSVNIYPAPAGEELYDGYTVRDNGQEVPVYKASRSPELEMARLPASQVYEIQQYS